MRKDFKDTALLELIAEQEQKLYENKESLKEAEENVKITQKLIHHGLREAEMLKARIEVLQDLRKELRLEEEE